MRVRFLCITFFFGNIRTGNNLSAIRDDVSTVLHVLYVCVPRAEIDTGARDDLLRAQASWRILVGMVFELHTFFVRVDGRVRYVSAQWIFIICCVLFGIYRRIHFWSRPTQK